MAASVKRLGEVVGGSAEAGDAGPQPVEPEAEPGALEARVAGDEDASVAPEIASSGHHVFHGARPACQSSSSWRLSRSVSIGCQNPS